MDGVISSTRFNWASPVSISSAVKLLVADGFCDVGTALTGVDGLGADPLPGCLWSNKAPDPLAGGREYFESGSLKRF